MNKVFLIGNITQDLELKQTPNGTNVLSFSIATNKRVKVNDEYENRGEFHNLVAWNKTAEIINQYQSKGSKIAVMGELQTRSWEAQDGTKRYRTEIIVNEVEFLSSSSNTNLSKTTQNTNQEEEITVENIPF